MKLPRHAELWLVPYLRNRADQLLLRNGQSSGPARVWLAIADHFEPFWATGSLEVAQQRIGRYEAQWPRIANSSPRDAAGRKPKYTFFYPQEEYRPELLRRLAGMVQQGIADVEVHIHHDREGREDFIRRVRGFCELLFHEHGLLRYVDGQVRFGFIHGNWALDNSLPGGLWCGLNGEIRLLHDLGCYADFTMPSGNSPSQTRMVNQIYWCTDSNAPKSYDRGVRAEIGGGVRGDLLMISGPLGLRWKGRLLPRMEKGEVAAHDPPSPYRVRRWFDLAPRIGCDTFIKLYTHGAQDANAETLLNGALQDTFRWVSEEADARSSQLYFVSAWEMYGAVSALCAGREPTIGAAGVNRGAGACGS